MAEIKVIDHSGEVLTALKTQVEAALEACGGNAVSYAKQSIARAGRVDTGALINSVSHEVIEDTCYVGTNQSYAIYHEVGTGIYTEGGGGRRTPWAFQDQKGEWHITRGVSPVHFLKNSVANHSDEYKAIIEQHLKS